MDVLNPRSPCINQTTNNGCPRNYVVVTIDPKTNKVADIRHPSIVEALPAIPPPLGAAL